MRVGCAEQVSFRLLGRESLLARRLRIEPNHALRSELEWRRGQQPLTNAPREHLAEQFEVVVDRDRRSSLRAPVMAVRLDVAGCDLGNGPLAKRHRGLRSA